LFTQEEKSKFEYSYFDLALIFKGLQMIIISNSMILT